MNPSDPIWRLNNFYKIVTKSGEKVTFKQNSVQRMLNKYTQKRRRILKARQMGISTNELLKMLDFVLFNKNKTAVILAHESDSIEKLFRIVRRAYDFMPDNLKPPLYRGGGSMYAMDFPTINSRIYCDLESRGDTIHYLHVSEKAFIEETDRVHATVEAVPLDGIITEESTPNGMNHFYDDYMDPDSNYTNIFLPWYILEDYQIANTELNAKDYTDEEKKFIGLAKKLYDVDITPAQIDFRRFKKRELKGMFAQEYAETDTTCFLTSGNSVFDLSVVKSLYDRCRTPIETIDGIRIYKRKEKDGIYIIGADTAEGVSGDASAAHVFEARTREQVASFHSPHLKPSEFADKLVQMAEMYDNGYPGPLLGVERNNHGHAVLLKLDEVHEYLNLYRTRKENKKTEQEEVKLGWITDRVTRPLMLDIFVEGVENGTIILNDKQTVSECLTLVNNDGKVEAEEGKHDDLVIAAAISIQLCIEEDKLSIYDGIGSKIKI